MIKNVAPGTSVGPWLIGKIWLGLEERDGFLDFTTLLK